jgi:hypothetical protein
MRESSGGACAGDAPSQGRLLINVDGRTSHHRRDKRDRKSKQEEAMSFVHTALPASTSPLRHRVDHRHTSPVVDAAGRRRLFSFGTPRGPTPTRQPSRAVRAKGRAKRGAARACPWRARARWHFVVSRCWRTVSCRFRRWRHGLECLSIGTNVPVDGAHPAPSLGHACG